MESLSASINLRLPFICKQGRRGVEKAHRFSLFKGFLCSLRPLISRREIGEGKEERAGTKNKPII